MKAKQFAYYASAAALFFQGCSRDVEEVQAVKATAPIAMSASVTSYGTFYITNNSSGKCMEVNGAGNLLYNGNVVQQYTYFGSGTATNANQKWIVIQQGTGAITSTTKFKIMNVASGKYVEVPLASPNPGVGLWQDGTNTNNAQQWYFQSVGSGSYKIINVGNGLAITNPGASNANGTQLTQAVFVSGNTAQYWTLNSLPVEAYRDDAVVNFFHRPNVANTTVAFDEGKSIPLTYGNNNGKVLWITEDAYDANQLQSNGQLYCQFFKYHNSGLLQPASHSWDPTQTPNITTNHSENNPLEIIGCPGDHYSTYRWPGVGVEIGNKVYIYTYESANGSTPANQALFSITQNTSGLNWSGVTRLTPNGMTGNMDISWSTGMIKKTAGDTVYVYGNKAVFFNANNVFLARYAASNPSVWTYWNGSSWTSSPSSASAAALGIGGGNTSQANVMVSYVNGKYVMMQMDLGYFCDPSNHNIYISTATSPKGPFTTPKLVFTIQDTYQGHVAKYYTPAIHPEFNNSHNELLVTYCLNYNGDGGSCPTNTCISNNQDPNFYQVKGVRIPYSLVGL